jgi:hypothetical protein
MKEECMKISKMKKVLLTLSLGLGLSAGMTGLANAAINGASCTKLNNQCLAGDYDSCQAFYTYRCMPIG